MFKNRSELRDGVLEKYHTGIESFEEFLKKYEEFLKMRLEKVGLSKKEVLTFKLFNYSDFLKDNFLRKKPKDLKLLIKKIKKIILELEEILEEENDV